MICCLRDMLLSAMQVQHPEACHSGSLSQPLTGCLRPPSLVDDSAFRLDHHLHPAQARAVPTFGQRPVLTTLLCLEKGKTGYALRWARLPEAKH